MPMTTPTIRLVFDFLLEDTIITPMVGRLELEEEGGDCDEELGGDGGGWDGNLGGELLVGREGFTGTDVRLLLVCCEMLPEGDTMHTWLCLYQKLLWSNFSGLHFGFEKS